MIKSLLIFILNCGILFGCSQSICQDRDAICFSKGIVHKLKLGRINEICEETDYKESENDIEMLERGFKFLNSDTIKLSYSMENMQNTLYSVYIKIDDERYFCFENDKDQLFISIQFLSNPLTNNLKLRKIKVISFRNKCK